MGCSSHDLVMWRDFPKGLRVLLLDQDAASASETKSKLEAMDYVVSMFCNEQDALEAISTKADSFHVAIVEVAKDCSYGSFKFLEMAKDIPTIAISNVPCITTTVKCIAQGAAEFLHKPLSEEKLRNIWQHVVHKAFNVQEDVLSKSLEPIKETVVSMLQMQSETNQKDQANELDILSAPSTPQLVKGGRSMKDEDFLDQTNSSLDKDNSENSKDSNDVKKYSRSQSKSVDSTRNNLTSADRNSKEVLTSKSKEEVDSQESNAVKEGPRPPHRHGSDNAKFGIDDVNKRKPCPHGSKGNRKKIKVDWSPELHKQFVRAVEELGIDQAIPSKILELMKVEGLTRHNVASHLQKYRMNRRHILPKDKENRCQPRVHTDPMSRGCMPRPPMVFRSFHSNYGIPPTQIYPVWGHPTYHRAGVPVWGYAGLSTSSWHHPQGNWLWKTNTGIHADTWGCPVVSPYSQCSIPTQLGLLETASLLSSRGKITTANNSSDAIEGRGRDFKDPYTFYLTEEMIDEVVKEAICKPWLPLPLGLNPPSTESVLAELHRQGIRRVPPPCR